MTSQLAVCVSILIFAALFLASAVASLFLENPQLPTIPGDRSSPSVQLPTSQKNSSSTQESTGGKKDRMAKKPKSWKKGDIIEDNSGNRYTFLFLNDHDKLELLCSDSKGALDFGLPKNFTRVEESEYEDKNYVFQIGDRVELLVKFQEIEKGTKGTVTGIQSEGFCEVEFSDGEKIRMNTLYLGKLKQKY